MACAGHRGTRCARALRAVVKPWSNPVKCWSKTGQRMLKPQHGMPHTNVPVEAIHTGVTALINRINHSTIPPRCIHKYIGLQSDATHQAVCCLCLWEADGIHALVCLACCCLGAVLPARLHHLAKCPAEINQLIVVIRYAGAGMRACGKMHCTSVDDNDSPPPGIIATSSQHHHLAHATDPFL